MKALGYYTMEFLTAILIPSLNTLGLYHKTFYGCMNSVTKTTEFLTAVLIPSLNTLGLYHKTFLWL